MLKHAYAETAYVVTDSPQPLVLRVGVCNQAAAKLLKSHGISSAVFITAHNPWSLALTPEQNQALHDRLVADIGTAWRFYSGFGVNPNGEWPAEASLLVLCDDLQRHDHWMEVYQQNAIVQVDATGDVHLKMAR